jgi:hypothetical protein
MNRDQYIEHLRNVALGLHLEGIQNWADLIVDNLHWVKEKTLTDAEIIESLAELEHEQWMAWADTIMQTEKISDKRFARWVSCMIPYSDLSEEMKEFDREWARKALAILKRAQEE